MGKRWYQFNLKSYQRNLFGLRNARGEICVQEGRWLRLQSEGDTKIGFGEMVSLDGFGVESLKQVDQFCDFKKGLISEEIIFSMPSNLSVTRSGFESAWRNLQGGCPRNSQSFPVAALLPAGSKGIKTIIQKKRLGFIYFKWKIGILNFEEEKKIFNQLYQQLPKNGKIRLDANGSLDEKTGSQWLSFLENYPSVDFLEQPLQPNKLELMKKWTAKFSTPIALDESIASSESLEDLEWDGIYVVKPSLLGKWNSFIQWAKGREENIVLSTAFESPVGVDNILKLAEDINLVRPLGFGVSDYLPPVDRKYHGTAPHIKRCLAYSQLDPFFHQYSEGTKENA